MSANRPLYGEHLPCTLTAHDMFVYGAGQRGTSSVVVPRNLGPGTPSKRSSSARGSINFVRVYAGRLTVSGPWSRRIDPSMWVLCSRYPYPPPWPPAHHVERHVGSKEVIPVLDLMKDGSNGMRAGLGVSNWMPPSPQTRKHRISQSRLFDAHVGVGDAGTKLGAAELNIELSPVAVLGTVGHFAKRTDVPARDTTCECPTWMYLGTLHSIITTRRRSDAPVYLAINSARTSSERCRADNCPFCGVLAMRVDYQLYDTGTPYK